MAELPEPEATGSNFRVKLVIGLVAILIVYLVYQSVMKAHVVSRLASKDSAERKVATQTLMDWKMFTDVMSRQTVPVKRPMVQTLREMNTEASAGELIALMKDRNPTVQNEAQFALFHMQPTSIAKLVAALKDADLNVKNRSALLLIQIGRPALAPVKDKDGKSSVPLLAAITDGGQRGGVTRVVSTMVTGARSPQEQDELRAMVVPELLKKLADEKADAATKACAVDIIGRIDAQSAAAQVRGLLNAAKLDGAVRKAVLVALARLKHPEALALLREGLADKDTSVQTVAIVGLGELRNPEAVPVLQPYLTGYDETLRDAAVAALTKIGPPAIAALDALLKHDRYEVRVGALRGLQGISDPRVVSVIAKALDDKDENVRWQAANALATCGAGNASVAPLLHALQDPAWRVATQAMDSLSQLGKPAIPGLVGVLSQPAEATAPFYAQQALQRIGSDAVPSLLSVAQSGNLPARERAVLALGTIADPRAREVLASLQSGGPAELRPVAKRALDQLNRGRRVTI